MRKISIDCDLCEERVAMDRAKEVAFETGQNAYHLMDLCPSCLDAQLQRAESVNDTRGWRQQAAVLVRLPDHEIPERR